MRNILLKYFPGTFKFLDNFFEAMSNNKAGHSLRKWLAVGFWWIMFTLSVEYTTTENLTPVLTIHTGMITALVITYTAGNIQEKKLDNLPNKPTQDEEPKI